MSEHPKGLAAERRIFCNRTLNLRSIKAIGFDMDYTLVHYNVQAWEGRAFDYTKENLKEMGYAVDDLEFDPAFINRGLVIDRLTGNIIKANRFGYIKTAAHGTKMIEFREMRKLYRRTIVDLGEKRFYFLNTLFSLSEASIYSQMVEKLDAGELRRENASEIMGYGELHDLVRKALDQAHVEGKLKADILADPEHFIEEDQELIPSLLDIKAAGKKLILITNSGYYYTSKIMDYLFKGKLPNQMKWTDLFDLSVVSARKPDFFINRPPIFEVVNEEGHLRPVNGTPEEGKIYLGGYASLIEKALNVRGDQILYVGDHIYGDVHVSKSLSQWRTCLVVRELEREVKAIAKGQDDSEIIAKLMDEKKQLEHRLSAIKLERMRNKNDMFATSEVDDKTLKNELNSIRSQLVTLDDKIRPYASQDGHGFNKKWGYMLRAGNDKSHMTRQIERHADLYTSRVSNFLHYTPFMYFRASRGALPHDRDGSYF